MPTIPSYPAPQDLLASDPVLGFSGGKTVEISIAQLASAIATIIGADPTLAEILLAPLLSGQVSFDLPDEASLDPLPAAGSDLPYLSGGVLKIA